MRFADDKRFLSGLIFAGIGALALWLGRDYRLGSATAMGPGYFPFITSVLLIGLGAANLFGALRAAALDRLRRPALRPLAMLALGVLLFGLTIERFGLLPAIVCLVACATLAGPRFRAWEAIALLVVLGAISGALFVFGLGLPPAYLARI